MSRAPYLSIQVRSSRPGRPPSCADIVAAFVREQTLGRLPTGCRLPPVRVLERQLGVAKGTVQSAYDELTARGVLETRPREGVFVAKGAGTFAAPRAGAAATAAHVDAAAAHVDAAAAHVDAGSALALPSLHPVPALFQRSAPEGSVALSTVLIDPDLLPRERMQECARSVLRERALPAVAQDLQGYPPLRALIAQRLGRRGIAVAPDQVILTCGSQQAIDLIARALLTRRVAVEDPVYPHARLLFGQHGVELTGLPLDPFTGVPIERWACALERDRPGLAYLITSFQNPTGYCYSTAELMEVLELAARLELPLFEDDWGSDMLSDSEYRPSLRALGGSRVLYANSFTKKLMPSLRVGFLIADPELVPALTSAKRLSTLSSPLLPEAAVFEFLDRGYYDTHLAALQAELDRRYWACLRALSELMPDYVRWTTPGGGPTLWLDLPQRIDLPELRSRMLARGVYIEDASPAFAGAPHLHGFRISYAYVKPEPLARALEALAAELRALAPAA